MLNVNKVMESVTASYFLAVTYVCIHKLSQHWLAPFMKRIMCMLYFLLLFEVAYT